MRNEPVGVRRLDRAPVLTPDCEPPGESHWCEAVGSRVYAPKVECPNGCAGEQ